MAIGINPATPASWNNWEGYPAAVAATGAASGALGTALPATAVQAAAGAAATTSVADATAYAQSTARARAEAKVAEAQRAAGCQTCKERRYQDGSNDPGVSFKSPQKISPDQAASAVMGHEMEHVVRAQAKAREEGAEVISQSVRLHSSICPECGRGYVSGGVTTTVTAKRGGKSGADYNAGKEGSTPAAGGLASQA